jgi:hypothetical protein
MFSAREHQTNLPASASSHDSRLAVAFTRRSSSRTAWCHRALAIAVSAAAVASAGCAARQQPKPDHLTDATIPVDPAMRTRDWDPAFAKYPNGAVVAGPTEFPFEPKRNQAGYAYYGADFLAFAANLAVMPYSLVVTPPWTKQTYYGAKIPPTSTAMPVPPPTRVPEPPPARATTSPPHAPTPQTTPTPTFVPVPVPSTQPMTQPAAATMTTSSAR